MKKFATIILSVILSIVALFGSGCKEQNKGYTFMVPDGAPALAISKLINDKDNLGTGRTINYSVISTTQVYPNLSAGKADFIIAPVNLASQLYKANSNDYVMVAVLTHGNFYILSTTQISIEDLKGKSVAVPNVGAVPGWTFMMVLEKYGLTYAVEDSNKDVKINPFTEVSFIVQEMMAGRETIGLVPEPAASNLEKNYLNSKGQALYRLDLQELYDSETKAYPQAVLLVKKSVLNANKNLVDLLQTKITESASWIKQNISTAVDAVNNNGGTTLKEDALSESAINGCKIYWESALDAKLSVKNYINKIIEIDSAKAIPVGDDFFYDSMLIK